MNIFLFYATSYRHICTDMAVLICLYLPLSGLYLPVSGLGHGRFAFATAAALPLRYVRRAATARSQRGQSIRRQIAIFIWTRSARPDSAVTAVADGNRCDSVTPR
jgi:hypothetical protein